MDIKDGQQLQKWIQENTDSNVTENFVKTIQRVATRDNIDRGSFIKSCMALGKFKGKEAFLSSLFARLTKDSTHIKPSTFDAQKRLAKRKKVQLSFEGDNEHDDDDRDILLHHRSVTPNPFLNKDKKSIKFKKIDKKLAERQNEYSQSPALVPIELKPLTNNSFSQEEAPYKFRDDTITEEDKDWYNYDDDYGNQATEEISAINELDFKITEMGNFRRFGNDSLHSGIRLYTLPINKRKEWLPPFLKDYTKLKNLSEGAIIGSITESSQEGLISPFRNPESEFSMNAKKGSLVVNHQRTLKEHHQRNKESTEMSGSAIGDILGIKDDLGGKKQKKVESVEATETTENIQATRESLPIFKSRSRLLSLIDENQVCIIIGETGSGKTTQLAQYLFENGICADGRMIGVTQPRRVAAMSVAKRVAIEMNTALGDKVGYAIRFEDYTSSSTRVKFMTDGILLRETLLDPSLEKYSCIIIDEAHERSLNTDVLMGIFKDLLSKRKDIKLIITSATMNAEKFSKYFGQAPKFTIPGRTFPVQLVYSKHPVSDYVESAVSQAVRIHLSNNVDNGDILIFMTGQEDIEATSALIKERLLEVYSKKAGIDNFEEVGDLEIFPIYSALPPEVQNRVFRRLETGKRKIVISTNIAETSLTIAGIRYVIDCGYSKLKVYNAKIGLDSLAITPISLANANQRSGRAGRTAPGIAYRLYTEEIAEEDMYFQTIPEIQRTNLSNTILLLKSLGVKDVLKFPFIDAPPLQTLMASIYELWFIGALDNFGNMTKLGESMAKIPLQPSLSKILLMASQCGCSEEMLTIVSMLSVPQVFYRPKEREKESDLARSRFFVPESDHLTLLNVYSQWKSNKYSVKWCRTHFLMYKSLSRARDIKGQLIKVMERCNIPISSSGRDWDIIRRCICNGFAHQAAKRSGLGKYMHLKTGMKIDLHPTSALFGLGDLPEYVVYNELLMTTKEYMCCVTAVDPLWLMDAASLLYDIKMVKEDNTLNVNYLTSGDENNENDYINEELQNQVAVLKKKREVIIERLKTDDAKSALVRNKENRKQSVTPSCVSIGFKRRRPL